MLETITMTKDHLPPTQSKLKIVPFRGFTLSKTNFYQ